MLTIGTIFAGTYRILAHLGELNGVQRYTGQTLDGDAVLLLACGPASAPRVLHIVDILRRVSHPSLPRPLDSFESDGSTFVAFEARLGESITKAWQDSGVSDDQRLTWLIEVCRAVATLEHEGVILYPLLLESVSLVDDRVVLIDPSCFLPSPIQVEDLSLPTPYMAPEMLGDPSQASSSANAYAIGTLAASLLLGRELNANDLQGGSLTPIREVVLSVSPEVDALLLRATLKDPDQRPVSASLLAELLEGLRGLLGVRMIPGAATNIGLIRLANEDRYLFRQVARQSPEGELSVVLAAVADGIGGEEGGEIASRLALSHLERFLAPQLSKLLDDASNGHPDPNIALALLQEAADRGDNAIRQEARRSPGLRDMGTTLATALLVGSHAYVANSGDSRAYLVGTGSFRQLSEDHTVVAEMVCRGELLPEQARSHPDRRRLTRALGYGKTALSFAEVDIGEAEALLLCTDGLTETVADQEIARIFETMRDPEVISRELVRLSNLVGGPDNITALIVYRVPRRLFGLGRLPLSNIFYCHECGAANHRERQLCWACGASLKTGTSTDISTADVICPSCSTRNPTELEMCSSCGWLLPSLPGSVFVARFEVIRLLGQGGMGRAYLVRDLQSGEHRVLKELITDSHPSREAQERYERYFRNEAEVQARLVVHAAFPKLLEPVQQHDRRLFFVMEYVEGEDLTKILRRQGKPFPIDRVRNWGIQLCEALDYLHNYELGSFIVHRDIAPDNIRLRGTDPEVSEVVLMDFGLARLAEHGQDKTPGLGRQGYAAPEQLLGKAEPRSDLYSLAATLYFLLTGRDPRGDSPLPSASELNPEVPNWLSQLIDKNLMEDPNQRSLSASSMREELVRGELSQV